MRLLQFACVLSLCAVTQANVPDAIEDELSTPFKALKHELYNSKMSSTATNVPQAGAAVEGSGAAANSKPKPRPPRIDVQFDNRYPNGINSTILTDTTKLLRPNQAAPATAPLQSNGTVAPLNISPAELASVSRRALLFTTCPRENTPEDKVTVNWMPNPDPRDFRTSIIRYQICKAASLQPRLVTGFRIENPGNSVNSRGFTARIDICGPKSATKVSCASRTVRFNGCLSGQVRAPFPFDPNAITATLSLLTTPPATTLIRLCL